MIQHVKSLEEMREAMKKHPYPYLVAISTKGGTGSMLLSSEKKLELWEVYGMLCGKEEFAVLSIQPLYS